MNIKEYEQEYNNRNAHRAGVAQYIRKPIQYTRHSDLPSIDFELMCGKTQHPKTKQHSSSLALYSK